jgi:hypothetical protein
MGFEIWYKWQDAATRNPSLATDYFIDKRTGRILQLWLMKIRTKIEGL